MEGARLTTPSPAVVTAPAMPMAAAMAEVINIPVVADMCLSLSPYLRIVEIEGMLFWFIGGR